MTEEQKIVCDYSTAETETKNYKPKLPLRTKLLYWIMIASVITFMIPPNIGSGRYIPNPLRDAMGIAVGILAIVRILVQLAEEKPKSIACMAFIWLVSAGMIIVLVVQFTVLRNDSGHPLSRFRHEQWWPSYYFGAGFICLLILRWLQIRIGFEPLNVELVQDNHASSSA